MTIETIHHLDANYPNGVSKTVKSYKLFGITLLTRVYYYPKTEQSQVLYDF